MAADYPITLGIGSSPGSITFHVLTGLGTGVTVRYPLHAPITNTLYHAEATTGESTPIAVTYNLVDEALNQIVDEAGNRLVVSLDEQAILFHARETDTLFHAEAT